jgi:hypothetical protein
MGNSESQIKNTCVSLDGMEEITNLEYTVMRGSGIYEEGWLMSKPKCIIENNRWIDRHAWRDVKKNEWRIFLHNNETDPNLFKCGWRRIDTIRPKHLTDEEEIKRWREALVDTLNKLYTAKVKLGPA